MRRMSVNGALKSDKSETLALNESMVETCRSYGFDISEVISSSNLEQAQVLVNNNCRIIPFSEIQKAAFEHDTPIKIIRELTPCEFEKMNFSPEELAKAEEYLKGVRNYFSPCWLPKEFIKDGSLNIEFIKKDPTAINVITNLKIQDRYFGNIIEADAIKVGEAIRDKFKLFIDTMGV